MKNFLTLLFAISISLIATGCVSNDQVKKAVQENPKILFDAIEENPEQFVEVVNRAVQKAQQNQQRKMFAGMKAAEDKDLASPKKPVLIEDRRLLGNDSAKIVVIEYADFQCPACRMNFESLKKFKEKHKGNIQFYYKNMPLNFHPMAMPAATYFEAIHLQGKDKALKFYHHVFENQRQMSDENFLKKAATIAGANMTKLQVDIKSPKVRDLIEADMAEFEKFGFTGTPAVIINGVALNGAQTVENLERIAKLTLEKTSASTPKQQ